MPRYRIDVRSDDREDVATVMQDAAGDLAAVLRRRFHGRYTVELVEEVDHPLSGVADRVLAAWNDEDRIIDRDE